MVLGQDCPYMSNVLPNTAKHIDSVLTTSILITFSQVAELAICTLQYAPATLFLTL